jgi:ATP-dependent helicase/nuclease subunit A
MVGKVLKSEILQRAKAARRRFLEVPFQKLILPTATSAVSGLPNVVRGVIDLSFEESAGWVIIDYKTDRVAASSITTAAEHYRPQVQTYAVAWHEMLGQPVHETGLYFTHVDTYVRL